MANKKFNSWIKNICMGWGFIMAGSMLSSCNDLMHDDLPPCDMGVDLQFKYDYNVQRADMFKDHVGGLCVFVYDEQGNFIARHDAYNDATSQPLKDPNYAMRINLEPGKYRFATFAFQKKYEDALAQPGAKFQIALPQQGDNITALHARLDREQGKVNNQSQPLDTLWQGLSNELVEVKDLQVTRHTIGLVRDTKQLTISLHQTDEPANINADDFSYQITNANGDISYDNSLLPDEELTYTPYYTWTTEFKDTEGNVKERTAHAALMFSRLIWHPVAENDKNAILTIINKTTGEEVARINLADFNQNLLDDSLGNIRALAKFYRMHFQISTRLIHQVDGLVWQTAVADIFGAGTDGIFQGVLAIGYIVELVVFILQALQYLDSLLLGRFLDVNLLEPAHDALALSHVTVIFLVGGRTDETDITCLQILLQHIGCIRSAI